MTFASGFERLDRLGDGFGLIVVDEAHHFGSGRQSEALEMCPARFRLGLTATGDPPGSPGAQRLEDLIGPVAYQLDVGSLVGTHLADVHFVRHRVALSAGERQVYERSYGPYAERQAALRRQNPELDAAGVARTLARTEEGRALLSGLERAASVCGLNDAKLRLVGQLLADHAGDRTLVFTALATHAHEISRRFLVPAITAEVPRAERGEILDRFRDGIYRTIVSARVLNEGLDVPDASVAIVVGARLGEREHVQRIGRVLRPAPGKRAVVHELVTADTMDVWRARRRRLRALDA
jgi:superfamily II DNA or RNA helicase